MATVLPDLPVGNGQTMDLYQPDAGGGRALLLVPGGLSESGDGPNNVALAQAMAARGYAVFVPTYTRSTADISLADLRIARDWMLGQGQGAEYGADMVAPLLLGASLGGGLALLLAAEGWFARLAVCSAPVSPTLPLPQRAIGHVGDALAAIAAAGAAFPPTWARLAHDDLTLASDLHLTRLDSALLSAGAVRDCAIVSGALHGPSLGLVWADAISAWLQG